jgi:hypothetical protein
MNSKNLTDRMLAIFGATMVFFYLGLGIFIIFSHSQMLQNIDITLRVMFGTPLLLYGVYRAITSINKIRESFFEKEENE